MKNEKYFVAIIFVLLSFQNASATANPILITISDDIDKVVFDGRWTFFSEWKHSSLNSIKYDANTVIQLRSAHQGNFIYVFVDVVPDVYLDKGADSAILCLDSDNNKNTLADSDDYCFLAVLDGKSAFVYQGGSPSRLNGNFKKIQPPSGFIGVGGVSDENDRYSLTPHAGYEFRIPTDLVGRKDVYGVYLGVYDSHFNKVYSWPQDIQSSNLLQVPNPSMWGEMISPDKSLPEFPLSFLMLISAFSILIYITKFSRARDILTNYGK